MSKPRFEIREWVIDPHHRAGSYFRHVRYCNSYAYADALAARLYDHGIGAAGVVINDTTTGTWANDNAARGGRPIAIDPDIF